MIHKYGKYLTTVGVAWGICALLLLGFYLFFVSPQNKARKQISRELAEKQQACESAEKAATEENKKRLAAQIENFRKSLESFVLDGRHSTDLTFDISRIANDRRVSSFSIGPRTDKTNPKLFGCSYISEEGLKIAFNAPFNDFAALLNDMERHSPVIFIDDFTITRAKAGDSLHQADMTLAVFVKS
jgi:Tfp pilus assembly protein PilO